MKAIKILGRVSFVEWGKNLISIWYDNWIDNTCLCNIVVCVHISDKNLPG